MCVSCQHIISTHGHQASSFLRVSLLLEEGDKVKVNLYPGQWIFDNENTIIQWTSAVPPVNLQTVYSPRKAYIKDVQSFPTKINLYNVTENNQVAVKFI